MSSQEELDDDSYLERTDIKLGNSSTMVPASRGHMPSQEELDDGYHLGKERCQVRKSSNAAFSE